MQIKEFREINVERDDLRDYGFGRECDDLYCEKNLIGKKCDLTMKQYDSSD